ncbi:hypothetical protein KUCAC02_025948 [Chaenocephalus aceratus]|uniref:Uncharacterized protein n=1 Tax=Chaenocephalus aceratus TaxID=36190 RepID=A0ACB9VX61_CHAAC|nr:hypothetical protein KUCAC02_025948 [Chaenocephalus aceratus]
MSFSRSACDKQSLSLKPGHRSRKWFCHRWVEQRGKERRETKRLGKRDNQNQHSARVCLGLSAALTLLSSPSLPVTLEQRGSAVLHVCLETVGQLELWLQEAQRSLVAGGAAAGATTMQDSVEQQLLTCQVSPAHQELGPYYRTFQVKRYLQ